MMDRFTLETSTFQGPLDALLNLIEARKLPISQVSLADVCDSYLAYVESLPQLPLGETAQFILIASTLLLIKSRTLLPTVELSRDEEFSIEELEQRLARLRIIRAATRSLRRRWGTQALQTPRRTPLLFPLAARTTTFSPGETSLESLIDAMRSLLSQLPKPERVAQATVAPVVHLEEVIVRLRNRITSSLRTRWSDLARNADKHDMIVHFLAILELVRSGSVSATQNTLFSDILLESEALDGTPRYGS